MVTELILVPTAGELDVIRGCLPDLMADQQASGVSLLLQPIGFGPIASAARTAELMARHRPQQVYLLGIAGAFDTRRTPVGTACRFDQVLCDGVGVGMGNGFQAASEVGWPQVESHGANPPIGDALALSTAAAVSSTPMSSPPVSSPPVSSTSVPSSGTLLSVCAASANDADRLNRMQRFPGVIAEDMEGFSVALACALAGVPLQIIRGISNRVGDRDKGQWQIEPALQSAAIMAGELMRQNGV